MGARPGHARIGREAEASRRPHFAEDRNVRAERGRSQPPENAPIGASAYLVRAVDWRTDRRSSPSPLIGLANVAYPRTCRALDYRFTFASRKHGIRGCEHDRRAFDQRQGVRRMARWDCKIAD